MRLQSAQCLLVGLSLVLAADATSTLSKPEETAGASMVTPLSFGERTGDPQIALNETQLQDTFLIDASATEIPDASATLAVARAWPSVALEENRVEAAPVARSAGNSTKPNAPAARR